MAEPTWLNFPYYCIIKDNCTPVDIYKKETERQLKILHSQHRLDGTVLPKGVRLNLLFVYLLISAVSLSCIIILKFLYFSQK